MNLTQCYKIMGLDENVTLDTLKTRYRRLAFQYHPDLNQDDPQAARKFQRVNEAYLILQKELADGTSKKFINRKQRNTATEQKQQTKQTQPKKTQRPFQGQKQAEQTQKAQRTREQVQQERKQRQERILNDLLKDPFAKKVYEDIFLRLKNEKHRRGLVRQETTAARICPKIFSRLKSWLQKRADTSATVHVAAKKLIPGNTINITITHPLTGFPMSLDVRLPYDFSVGRILRLKKKGKNLGLWKGDLYLRFLPK